MTRVLIAGGGIAGPVTAMALQAMHDCCPWLGGELPAVGAMGPRACGSG